MSTKYAKPLLQTKSSRPFRLPVPVPVPVLLSYIKLRKYSWHYFSFSVLLLFPADDNAGYQNTIYLAVDI